MYTIFVKSNDTLIATQRQNIMHRSSLVRQLRFLVDPTYGNQNLNMADYVCVLEYRTPISNTYVPVVLNLSEELYKDKLEYVLDIGTDITNEVGLVELQLKWMTVEMLSNGNFKDHVRSTASTTIEVLPVNQWSDYISDTKLDNIVQIMLANKAQGEQIKAYADYLYMTKADGMNYDKNSNELSLTANGQKIDSVKLEDDCKCEDGVPIVDFSNVVPDKKEEIDNVVEFYKSKKNVTDNVTEF